MECERYQVGSESAHGDVKPRVCYLKSAVSGSAPMR